MKTSSLKYEHAIPTSIALLATLLALLALAVTASGQATILVPFNHPNWKYEQSGNSLDGTGWQQSTYDDTAWPVGTASFAVPAGEAVPPEAAVNTTLVLTQPGLPQTITYYYRTTFEVTGDPSVLVVTASNVIDDGAVFYINGTEIGRVAMPAGDVTYSTIASRQNDIGGSRFDVFTVPAGIIQPGINTLAVEVHQGNTTGSSDTVFGMSLSAVAASPPVITVQPVGTNILEGRSATLSVTANAAPAPTYQWFKDFAPILDATNRTYTINNMSADQAGQYHVSVSNPYGTVDSDVVTVGFIDDTFPPVLQFALADVSNPARVTLQFDESVTGYADNFSYFIDYATGGAASGVVGFEVNATTNQVILLLDPPLDPSLRYIVTINGFGAFMDLFGNPLPDGTTSPILFPKGFYDGNPSGYAGTQDTEVHSNAGADTPLGANANWTVDLDDGGVAQGLVHFADIFGFGSEQIPTNATIHQAFLRLVTENPTDAGTPIRVVRMLEAWDEATVTWNSLVNGLDTELGVEDGRFDGSDSPGVDDINVTVAVQEYLNAVVTGQPFHGWALIATGGNGWDGPTSESGNVAGRPALIIAYSAPETPCGITQQPSSVTVDEGASFTLSVETTGTSLTYQWHKDNVPIPGATARSYTVAAASPSQHPGLYHVVVENSLGACTSDGAIVSITADTQGDQIVSAVGNEDQTTIVVTFSDSMDQASAESTASYSFNPPLVPLSAVLSSNRTAVTISTDARIVGVNYDVQVTGVRDDSEAGNLLSPDPAIAALTQRVRVLTFSNEWKYDNSGADLGDAWKDVGYDDSAWLSGPGMFGLETTAGTIGFYTANGLALNTPWTRTNASGTTNITDYVRTSFNWIYDTSATTWELRHITDDGHVVYVNGTDAARFNVTNGPINYLSEALIAAPEALFRSTNITGFICGDNVLAVSVHQNGIGSSDVVWGAELIAIVPSFSTDCPLGQPTLSIANNGNGTVTINSTGPGTLYRAPALSGPWTLVGATFPVDLQITEGQEFFQIRP